MAHPPIYIEADFSFGYLLAPREETRRVRLYGASAGSYPRVGERPEEQLLRRTISAWERGQVSEAELEEACRAMVRLAIEEQESSGLDLVTDGQIRWYDPVSHILRSVKGVEIDGLLRYFDTNFYFRQPVIVGPVEPGELKLLEEYRFARSVASKPVKPVLTGPYTLARLSINRRGVYPDLDSLCEALGQVVARELEALAREGAELIQIDEPSILKHPEDLGLVRASLDRLRQAAGSSRLALYTYFGDASGLWRHLVELPVDVVGLDFTYSPGLKEAIAGEGCPKALGLGLIDARNTKMEDEEAVVKELERILPAVRAEEAYLNPSSGLELLPRDKARAKLELVGRICARLRGGGP